MAAPGPTRRDIMAAFATLTAAEQRAVAKVKDGTWINAHSERLSSGSIAVRVQRKMSAGAGLVNG